MNKPEPEVSNGRYRSWMVVIVAALVALSSSPVFASKKNTRANERDAKKYCQDYKKKTGVSCKVYKCRPRIGYRKIKKYKRKFSIGYCVYISKTAKRNQNKDKAAKACTDYKKKTGKKCWVHKGRCPVKRMPLASFGKLPDKYKACREKKGAERLKKAADKVNPFRKRKYKTWRLNVKYYIALKECAKFRSAECRKIKNSLRAGIREAERLYSSKPALKIRATFVYIKRKGGKDLEHLKFKNGRKRDRFLDKYFDNVARSRTRGHMTVLLVRSLTVKGKTAGGVANFPHWVNPFNRKRGVVEAYTDYTSCKYKTRGTFAHELGHVTSLKHTFERFAPICAKGYKKGEKGKGKTLRRARDGVMEVNLMDYNRVKASTRCPYRLYLNKCQKRRAAKQRRIYMTRDGKTNYRRIKGLR